MKRNNIPQNMSRMDSKEEVLNDIKNFCITNNTTNSIEYRKRGAYSEGVITRLFGTWENAMNELGFKYIGKKYGYDYILSHVKEVYDKYGYISRDLIDSECPFTY